MEYISILRILQGDGSVGVNRDQLIDEIKTGAGVAGKV